MHLSRIPELAGIRYYPSNRFFLGAQDGVGILTSEGREAAFNWQPQLGLNTEHFQIALNYNGMIQDQTNLGHIGLTGIFKFGAGHSEKNNPLDQGKPGAFASGFFFRTIFT